MIRSPHSLVIALVFAQVVGIGGASLSAEVPAPLYAYLQGTLGSRQGRVIVVVDMQADRVVATIGTGMYGRPIGGLAVEQGGRRIYVSDPARHQVRVLDSAEGGTVGTIDVPSVGALALSASGDRLFATSAASVVAIDTINRQIVSSVSFAYRPTALILSPTGSVAYVALESPEVAFVDFVSGTYETVRISRRALSLAVNPSGTEVYVADWKDTVGHFINVISTVSRASVATVVMATASTSAGELAVSPDGKWLYSSREDGSVASVDLVSRTVGAPLVSKSSGLLAPAGLLVIADGAKVLVLDRSHMMVHFRRTGPGPPIAPVWVGGGASDVAGSNAFAGALMSIAPRSCSDPLLGSGCEDGCTSDWDCPGAPALLCNEYYLCGLEMYRCVQDTRLGMKTCQYAGTCPVCRP